MSVVLRVLLTFLACSVHASVTSVPAAQTTPVAASSNATCPSRTINYITHGLPQQCLTSSWKSTSPTPAVNATTAAPSDGSLVAVFVSNGTTLPSYSTESSLETSQLDETPAETLRDGATTTVHESSTAFSTAQASPNPGTDEPSPLEDEKFMSFEEWKKQNLQKVGQSEHVGRDAHVDRSVPRKRPGSIHTALDALGDDAEIDLDFSGFIPEGPDLQSPDQPDPSGKQDVNLPDPQTAATPTPGHRSKDAGTTCKERYNYASFDCAANVRKWNPEATTPLTVLGENKDSYMLNVCSVDNKFLIIELCNDISIDTIVLANFEFFSSTFRTFRVSVSDRYPVKIDKWKTLGTFEARNSREVQAFLIENPVIWARYLRIEFLTHYGSEYYCPVSLVRVHGKTMMEEYKHDMESLQGDDEDSTDQTEAVEAAGETLVPEAVADIIRDEREREAHETGQKTAAEASGFLVSNEDGMGSTSTEILDVADTVVPEPSTTVSADAGADIGTSPLTTIELARTAAMATCPVPSPVPENRAATSKANTGHSSAANTTQTTTATAPANNHLQKDTDGLGPGYKPAVSASSENVTSTSPSARLSQQAHNTTATPYTTPALTSSERPKSSLSATQNHAAAPTMQESFFKSVQKRLQMLEANSSLSLQYIEDQSRALRDAFNRVEQKQLAKTTTFLDYLNTTVLSELRDFRQQYDQLWQSTVIELEMQRERYQQETVAINARLGILADELILQKRVSILQMILILVCLGLVMFSRGNLNQYLEMPVVQRVLSRSPSTRWLNTASVDTSSQSPPPTRNGSLVKRQSILKGHRRMHSEDSVEGSLSPQEVYSPPTPISMGDAAEVERIKDEDHSEDPSFDPSSIERPSTSPPILPSSSTPSTPDMNDIAGHQSIDSRLLSLSLEHDHAVPRVVVEEATPPTRHLTWNLPPNS